MGIAERKKREKELRRKQIQDAAIAVFMKKDFHSVTIEDIVKQAKALEYKGHDVVGMRAGNVRDKTAVRSAIEQMQAVRSATNLLIMLSMTIIDPSTRPNTASSAGGTLIADAIEIAKTFEDAADILFFKPAGAMTNHPTGWNMAKGEIPD